MRIGRFDMTPPQKAMSLNQRVSLLGRTPAAMPNYGGIDASTPFDEATSKTGNDFSLTIAQNTTHL
jgi:hypothetical protein